MSEEDKSQVQVDTKNESNDDLLSEILSKPREEFIPWEDCELPSLGMYYDGKVPGGNVQIRSMTLRDEEIFATPRLVRSGKAISHVFKNCVKFPNEMDMEDLLVGDQVFLLYYLRGITHGNEYEFAFTCTDDDCKRQSIHLYDLNQLANTIKRPNPELKKEPFKIVLPHMTEKMGQEVWVTIRLLRARDINTITRNKGAQRRLAVSASDKDQHGLGEVSVDQTLSQNINLIIDSVLGNKDRGKIRSFVRQMPARDSAEIREWLKDNTPGIDTSIKIRCPECENEMSIDLPITESFFRPVKSGGNGK